MPFSRLLIGTVILSLLSIAGWTSRQSKSVKGRTSDSSEALRAFLQDYLKDDLDGDARVGKQGLRFSSAFADLNTDGKSEAVVYLETPHFCGNGGCPLMVLAQEGTSYRIVTEIPVTRLPVRMLSTSSHGWRDLA